MSGSPGFTRDHQDISRYIELAKISKEFGIANKPIADGEPVRVLVNYRRPRDKVDDYRLLDGEWNAYENAVIVGYQVIRRWELLLTP